MEDIGIIGPCIWRAAIYFQGFRHQPARFGRLACLRLDEAEQVKRVKIFRRCLKRARVKFFGVPQLSPPVQVDCGFQSLRKVEWTRRHVALMRTAHATSQRGD